MSTLNPVCWFDIYVADLTRAKSFYESVFDVKLVDLPPDWGKQSTFPFTDQGANTTGALVEKENFKPVENNTIIYFQSEDCITEESRIEAAGGKIIRNKMPIGEFGFVSVFQDTEGNVIGLHSKK